MKTDTNVVPLHPEDDLNVVTTTADRVDALLNDMRDLVQATERFHAVNTQEHHHICGRLDQVEHILLSISARLNIVLSDLQNNQRTRP